MNKELAVVAGELACFNLRRFDSGDVVVGARWLLFRSDDDDVDDVEDDEDAADVDVDGVVDVAAATEVAVMVVDEKFF